MNISIQEQIRAINNYLTGALEAATCGQPWTMTDDQTINLLSMDFTCHQMNDAFYNYDKPTTGCFSDQDVKMLFKRLLTQELGITV